MKYTSLVIVALLSSCASVPTQFSEEYPALSPAILFNIGSNSAVRILTENGYPHGSGFIIETPSHDKVVITNEHVCRDQGKSLLLFQSLHLLVEATYKQVDKQHDLCYFIIPADLKDRVKGLHVANSNLLEGDFVAEIGYPLDRPLAFSSGFVSGRSMVSILDDGSCGPGLLGELREGMCIVEEELYMTNSMTFPGNSGSMALNDRGFVVGVFNSGNNMTYNGNYIPLEYLNNFIRDL